VRNKLSSVVLAAVQTNTSLVFPRNYAKKRTQSKVSLANCCVASHMRTRGPYLPHVWITH